jgi:hypothetical protein
MTMSLVACKPRIASIFIRLSIALAFSTWASPALAQRADVPQADNAGNFRSSRVQGNRGFYQQLYWLVVDKDPAGLNCRLLHSSQPYAKFQYGDIIRAEHYEPGDDAISIHNGQTWLRVISQDTWRIRDLASRANNKAVECIVRANSTFVAPINLDDLREIKW